MIKTFVEDRDWNQFHDPKNVCMLIATEAADIFFGILLLCDRCNIDLSKALDEKMKVNTKRYPVEKIN